MSLKIGQQPVKSVECRGGDVFIDNDENFANYINCTDYVDNEGVKSIRPWAFGGNDMSCASFSKCMYIGSYAFDHCDNLQNASFPRCGKIYPYAFRNCNNLTQTSFPMCSYVGEYAFEWCGMLKTISLPRCTEIMDEAFLYCTNLQSIYLTGSSVANLEDSAESVFYNTKILRPGGTVYVAKSMVSIWKNATNWVEISDKIIGI